MARWSTDRAAESGPRRMVAGFGALGASVHLVHRTRRSWCDPAAGARRWMWGSHPPLGLRTNTTAVGSFGSGTCAVPSPRAPRYSPVPPVIARGTTLPPNSAALSYTAWVWIWPPRRVRVMAQRRSPGLAASPLVVVHEPAARPTLGPVDEPSVRSPEKTNRSPGPGPRRPSGASRVTGRGRGEHGVVPVVAFADDPAVARLVGGGDVQAEVVAHRERPLHDRGVAVHGAVPHLVGALGQRVRQLPDAAGDRGPPDELAVGVEVAHLRVVEAVEVGPVVGEHGGELGAGEVQRGHHGGLHTVGDQDGNHRRA